jgi:Mg2+ and Co2+ transporter CorA
MPISFLAGFFGMNFFQPTSSTLLPWTSDWAFIVVMVVVIGVPILMGTYMRQRRWM